MGPSRLLLLAKDLLLFVASSCPTFLSWARVSNKMNTLRPKRQAFAKCCERIAKHYEDYESDWSSDEQLEYETDTGDESFIATREEGEVSAWSNASTDVSQSDASSVKL